MYLLNAACRNAACQNAACHNAACQNAEFEPKGVWAAMRNWKSWGEYQTKFHERDKEAAKVILLSAFFCVFFLFPQSTRK